MISHANDYSAIQNNELSNYLSSSFRYMKASNHRDYVAALCFVLAYTSCIGYRNKGVQLDREVSTSPPYGMCNCGYLLVHCKISDV